jgi:hypothetical protein
MRKRLLLFLLAGLGPAGAHAQSTSINRSMTVNASVPRSCTIGAATLQPGAQVNFRGLNGSALQIDQLVDPATLSTNAASIEITFEAICNLPHRVKIETQNNGLWQRDQRGATRSEGFADAIPYRARMDWKDDVLQLNADARVRRTADSSLLVNEGRFGDIRVRLDIDAGSTNVQANAPIVAGSYGDTLRIFLEPQQ